MSDEMFPILESYQYNQMMSTQFSGECQLSPSMPVPQIPISAVMGPLAFEMNFAAFANAQRSSEVNYPRYPFVARPSFSYNPNRMQRVESQGAPDMKMVEASQETVIRSPRDMPCVPVSVPVQYTASSPKVPRNQQADSDVYEARRGMVPKPYEAYYELSINSDCPHCGNNARIGTKRRRTSDPPILESCRQPGDSIYITSDDEDDDEEDDDGEEDDNDASNNDA